MNWKTYDELFPDGTVKPLGMCHITGPSGVGKSLFSIGLVMAGLDPGRVAVIDCEQSLQVHHAQLKFRYYYDMTKLAVEKLGLVARPADYFKLMTDIVSSLPVDGSIDLLVIDNIQPIEEAIVDEVTQHPERYGLSKGQVDRTALKWGPIKNLYSKFIQSLRRVAKIYILTSHLKQVFAPNGQPVPGLMRPAGKRDVLEQQTFLRIWLKWSHKGSRVPDGLVLKNRLVRLQITPEGPKALPTLPNKLAPCTWERIIKYLHGELDPTNPPPEEIPSGGELARLRGALTPEQIELFKMVASATQPQEEPPETGSNGKPPETLAEFLTRIGKAGMTLPDVLGKLGKKQASEIDPASDWVKLNLD